MVRVLAAVGAVLLVGGCSAGVSSQSASAGAKEVRITTIEQVVGNWYGCYNDHGVNVLSMTIGSDGIARFTFQLNPTLAYFVEPRDGVLYLMYLGCRDRPCPGEGSRVQVVEERGRQYITVPGRNNAPWVECSRSVK